MKNNLHVFLGATVADAAARPLHWVYNQNKLLTYINGKKDFTFLKKNKSKKIVLLDIPLYLENKMYQKGDVIIFLKTKRRDVIKRLKKRKKFNKNLLKILRKFQLTLKQKQKKSKYILVNNYNSANIKNKVKILKNKILNDRSSS